MSAFGIYERQPDGKKRMIGSVASDDHRTAFMSALFQVKQQYQKTGTEQPMFDCEPKWFAEPI